MALLQRSATLTALLVLSLSTFAQQKPSAAKPAAETQTPAVQTEAKPELTTPAPAASLALPMGTAVKMKLETILSTVANKAGDPFAGFLSGDFLADEINGLADLGDFAEFDAIDGRGLVKMAVAVDQTWSRGAAMKIDNPRIFWRTLADFFALTCRCHVAFARDCRVRVAAG